jgi:dihydroflavonol-4-reductase
MKAFITGATGFVGSHVAFALAEQGADLRLLVRSTSRTDNISRLKAERVIGDLREPASLARAMAGCEFVFHVAADYRLWVRDPAEMYRANVEGTRAIIEAASASGVRRVVYCSSVATMGFTESGVIVDENTPVSLEDMIGHYKRSKFMAEQIALEAGRSGANVVVVNPTTPIGECDIKPTPTGRIIVDFLNRKFPAYVDTGLNLADVKEVARGHLLAMEHAVPGQRYILGGDNLTLKQILDKLEALTGLPSPTAKVPHAVAMGFAVLDEFFAGRVLGKEPRATVEAVRMGRKKMFASSDKAVRELGYRLVPVEGALERAVHWFQARGYAPSRPQAAPVGA